MTDENERLLRPRSDALEAILGQRLAVLDDGFVRVIDYMGDDSSIVQAARVSYGVGTKRVHEDRGLVRYLLRHMHSTPFEMCEIKLHVRVPMDTWRQWIRHRMANVNEYSTRYSVAIDAAQKTLPSEWRLQSTTNKQGSDSKMPATSGEALSAAEQAFHLEARRLYESRLAAGVAREQARKDLPLSTYTEAYWKIDLHNLLHFLALRMDAHAQAEIRAYATVIGEQIVSRWCPVVWEAFVDYRLEARRFSRMESRVLAAILSGDESEARKILSDAGLLHVEHGKVARSREREEFEQKLLDMGIQPFWLTSQP